MFGKDPKLYQDFKPQGEKFASLPPAGLEMFKQLGLHGGFPSGLVELFIQGKIGGGIGSSTSAAKQPETPVEVVAQVEKTNFDVLVKGFSAEGKVKLIREVKNVLNIGLKDAKDKVEAVGTEPILMGKQLPKEQAEELEKKLKEIGAEVELK